MCNEMINFDMLWSFKLETPHISIMSTSDSWRTVDLPHDFTIEGSYKRDHNTGRRCGFLPGGIGWYQKILNIGGDGFSDAWLDQVITIHFDGVYMNSQVWINGHLLGEHHYGYTSFSYELTDFLVNGRNTIIVRVDNSNNPSGRWYTGSGIYRHVWLSVRAKTRIDRNAVYIWQANNENNMPILISEFAILSDDNELSNSDLSLDLKLQDPEGQLCAFHSIEKILPSNTYKITIIPSKIFYWSPDDPSLYEMTIELKKNMKIIDSIGLKTGIRHFRFDPNEGFFLNQKRIFIKGMCMHHDAGPFGVAVPDQLLAHRLQQLKEMGCNAIRTSHNPFSPEFYDLCDQMGFLVLDEFFDGWHGKADSDYGARFFHDDWKQDVRDTIIRDRNHVCIFMWSIGNETGKNDKYGISDIVHDLDHCGRKYQASAWKPAAIRLTTGGDVINGVDVEGFNAHCEIPGWLEKHRQQAPEKCVILTEAPHVLQTRGHYRTQTDYWNGVKDAQHIPDLSEEGEIFTNDDGPSYSSLITYHSSYDNSIFYNNHQGVLKIVQDNTYIMGQFAWTAFDYLGESFGWPFRMSDAGIIDLCGFPKDAYYLYKSQWTETAVLHLLPHWTFPGIDGKIINVVAYTNCEEVELFLNGKSIGMKKREIADMTLQWNVPYTQGILRAVGIKNGREISFEHRTAGASKGLNVECINLSKGLLKFDFSAVDSKGVQVPNASNRVFIKLNGQVALTGMENGDPADLESHNTGNRRLFNGLCTAYIKLMEEIESPINFYNFKDQENEAVTNVKIYNNDIVNGYGTISFSMDNNITEKSNTDLSLVPISFRIIGRWEDASGNKYVFREDRSVDLLTPTCKVQNKCNWWYDDESETGHLNYMWKHSLMHLNSDSELLLEQNNNVIILKRSEGN